MKRYLVILATFITFAAPVFAAGGTVMAAEVFQPCNGPAADTDVCKDASAQGGNNGNNNPIVDIISAAIRVISYLIGAAAIIGILVSGIRMMTAGGDSQAVASARSGLVYSLVGVLIAVLAQVLVAYVLDKAG
jgi:hypothetical protein